MKLDRRDWLYIALVAGAMLGLLALYVWLLVRVGR